MRHTRVYNKNDGDIQLRKNFRLFEFASSDTNLIIVTDELLDILQAIRDKIGKPIRVTSGFRSEAMNKKVGGTANSRHKLGLASDITFNGISKVLDETADFAIELGARGIGRYYTRKFIHIDVRDEKLMQWIEE